MGEIDRILHNTTTEASEHNHEQHTEISQEGISKLISKIQNQNTCGFFDQTFEYLLQNDAY